MVNMRYPWINRAFYAAGLADADVFSFLCALSLDTFGCFLPSPHFHFVKSHVTNWELKAIVLTMA